MSDHPDLEKLPLEVDGIPVRETVREIFRNPENGLPNKIRKMGCWSLALKSDELGKGAGKSHIVWNEWFKIFFGTEFGHQIDFSGLECTINNRINFSKFNFENQMHFSDFKFDGPAYFENANFGLRSTFRGAVFPLNIQNNGLFYVTASFKNAKYRGLVDFSAIHHSGKEKSNNDVDVFPEIHFDGANFGGVADFSNRKFKGKTSFKNVCFSKAPIFHNCELHQDTTFEGAKFPLATGSEEAVRAYRTLKLAFSKQQAVREEQRFFRLEMEEETLRETGLKRLLFQAYKTFSDYGFSITRPLKYGGLAVLVLTALYGLLSWLGQCGLSVQACHFAPQWLEFSLLQTLPLPGLDKLSEAASKAFWPQGAWWSFGLSALVILHKTLSLAVLFLIGLALRNLFKLK